MPEQPQLAAIVTYLQTHRATHDRELLRQRLLHDGAPEDLVDQAIALVYGPDDTTTSSNTSADPLTPINTASPTPSLPSSINIAAASPDVVGRIQNYLEQHRHTYDREALRHKLLADGHPMQAVDLAMAQVYGLSVTSPEMPSDPPTSRTPFLLSLFGVLLLNFVASCTLTTIMFSTDFSPSNVFVMAALIPIELAIMAYFWRRNRPAARGFMWALIASLPVVAMGLLLGFCVAIASAY